MLGSSNKVIQNSYSIYRTLKFGGHIRKFRRLQILVWIFLQTKNSFGRFTIPYYWYPLLFPIYQNQTLPKICGWKSKDKAM